jgi:hypothetical protein
VDDQAFPCIYSNKTSDHFARAADGMPGPSFEYHMFRLATGMEISEAEFEGMAERVFNLERAVQVRNWDRSRQVDERVIPHFESIENWVNPYVGRGVGLDREKFAGLLDEYYTLRGWDVETGRPTAAKLRELGLADVAEELTRLGLAPDYAGDSSVDGIHCLKLRGRLSDQNAAAAAASQLQAGISIPDTGVGRTVELKL